MTDIREKHKEVRGQGGINFTDLNWYAVGEHVRDSLLGKEPSYYEFVVTQETIEDMKERGFTQTEDRYFKDTLGNPFVLAEENNSLEAHLRKRDFTINSIAMSPGKQDYHFPLMNHYDEDKERPEEPVNPVKDLEDKVIRHTTDEGFEQLDDREERVEELKEELDGFTVADETTKKVS